MKSKLITRVKLTAGTMLLAGFALVANAQDVQTAPVWASAAKVDGKSTEWSALQATNKATKLTYTLANDDKNLYLVIQSNDVNTNNKIMLGGISLAINTDNKKKLKDAYVVTYPLVTRVRGQQGRGQGQPGGGGFGGGGQGGQGRGGFGGAGGGQQMSQAQRDSAALARHKTELAGVKEIKVLGFKNITDSLISIYNEYGVKASASFDNAGLFTYELSIPLESMGLKLDSKEFSYNVRVNGLNLGGFGGGGGDGGNRGGGGGGGFGGGGGGFGGGGGGFGGGGGGGFGGGGNRGGGGGGGNDDRQAMFTPTDFWAKYTLAKK